MKVLIIESSSVYRELMRETLEHVGFTVLPAAMSRRESVEQADLIVVRVEAVDLQQLKEASRKSLIGYSFRVPAMQVGGCLKSIGFEGPAIGYVPWCSSIERYVTLQVALAAVALMQTAELVNTRVRLQQPDLGQPLQDRIMRPSRSARRVT